jgi:Uma2 family endonuclease
MLKILRGKKNLQEKNFFSKFVKKIKIMFDDTNIQTQFPLAVLGPQKEPRNYTLSEYLCREEKLDRLNEYYDGIIKKLPMANGTHNLIATNMSTALNIILSLKNNNHIVLGGKQLVYLPMLNWGVYPDVLTVIDTPQYFDTDETLLINPLIIIEVLAKNMGKYNRFEKLEEYKTLDSLHEYILIDPKRCYIKTHFKEEQHLWRDSFFTDPNGSLFLKSVNCEIPMSAIYKNITFKKSVQNVVEVLNLDDVGPLFIPF